MLVAVHRRLDVEQHEVVAAVAERGDDAAQALDGRGVGEERHDDAEGLATARATGPGRAGWAGSRAPRWRPAPGPASSGLTFGRSFRTRDTVPAPTPACAATSAIVTISPSVCPLVGLVEAIPPRTANLGQVRRSRQPSSALRLDDVGVPTGARLRRADLGGEVDVHDAEAVGVALGPLEVVEERPHEVAAQVDAARRSPRAAARTWASRYATRSASSNGSS